MSKECTLLINSCDAYSDVWYPFFKILKAQWPELDMPIVLNTEEKNYSMLGLNIECLHVLEGKEKTIPWAERLLDVLERIPTDYILFMLDDYLLQEPVNDKVIRNCLEWMEQDKEIVTFTLVPSGYYARSEYPGVNTSQYPGFGQREGKDGRLVAGPGIWRREALIKTIRPFEDPWVWELYGSMRERKNRGKFYCCKLDAPQVFVYDYKRGGAIHRGLWVGCYVRPLFEKYGIEIDLEERGVDEDWLQHPPVYKKWDIARIIRNRTKMIRSLLG